MSAHKRQVFSVADGFRRKVAGGFGTDRILRSDVLFFLRPVLCVAHPSHCCCMYDSLRRHQSWADESESQGGKGESGSGSSSPRRTGGLMADHLFGGSVFFLFFCRRGVCVCCQFSVIFPFILLARRNVERHAADEKVSIISRASI